VVESMLLLGALYLMGEVSSSNMALHNKTSRKQ